MKDLKRAFFTLNSLVTLIALNEFIDKLAKEHFAKKKG